MLAHHPPEPETFEKELAQIQEKERDLKGEQRRFLCSIVERAKNNVDVLRGFRDEHTILRAKLDRLVEDKREKPSEPNLDSALKHRSHEVNFLKQQLDLLKHEKEDAINRQIELDIIVANFRNAENAPHPEFDRIKKLKNKLDTANIKNGERKNLMRIYSGVIRQFDKQEMH
jgi:hypothetical protein